MTILDEPRQLRHLGGGGAAAEVRAKLVKGADGLLHAQPVAGAGGGRGGRG